MHWITILFQFTGLLQTVLLGNLTFSRKVYFLTNHNNNQFIAHVIPSDSITNTTHDMTFATETNNNNNNNKMLIQ